MTLPFSPPEHASSALFCELALVNNVVEGRYNGHSKHLIGTFFTTMF